VFIIRLLFILTLIALAVSGALYLFTGNRRYLAYVWTVFKAGVALVVILGALVIAERLVVL
jgi:hypothetical protein